MLLAAPKVAARRFNWLWGYTGARWFPQKTRQDPLATGDDLPKAAE